MHNRKTWLQNIVLVIFSLTFLLLIGEWLFPKYLNKVPFRLYGGVKHELRILAQYSKQSVLPENYIAIFGDSNSVGVGDLYIDLTQNSNKRYPDYSPAHFINNKVGVDVVSFGFAGAGSIDGVVSGPVHQFKYIKSKGFDLKPPKTLLVLFYEGNDLGNNLQFLKEKYEGNEKFNELLTSDKFREWLHSQFQKPASEYDGEIFGNLIFTNFLIKSVKNIFSEKSKKRKTSETATALEKLFSHVVINGKARPLVDSPGSIRFPAGSVSHVVVNDKAIPVSSPDRIRIPEKSITQAVINGKTEPLPGNLQAPPIFLGIQDINTNSGLFEDMLKVSYFIFEETIKRIIELFPNSDVKIIYLPSVLSSYKIVSGVVPLSVEIEQCLTPL
jgi:hypothetical protein